MLSRNRGLAALVVATWATTSPGCGRDRESYTNLASDTSAAGPTGLAPKETLTYGIRDGVSLLADVFRPSAPGSYPVIVLVHGGCWIAGERSKLESTASAIAQAGFAVMAIEYRLLTVEHSFPCTATSLPLMHANRSLTMQDQADDVRLAVEFAKTRAPEWQGDPARLGIIGFSAGAHLSLVTAYTGTPGIKAVADWFGPTDLDALQKTTAIPPRTAGDIFQKAQAGRDLSPVNLVTADSPKTLLLHGEDDTIAPLAQAEALVQKLQAAGVTQKLVVYPDDGHGLIKHKDAATLESIAFFRQYL